MWKRFGNVLKWSGGGRIRPLSEKNEKQGI